MAWGPRVGPGQRQTLGGCPAWRPRRREPTSRGEGLQAVGVVSGCVGRWAEPCTAGRDEGVLVRSRSGTLSAGPG